MTRSHATRSLPRAAALVALVCALGVIGVATLRPSGGDAVRAGPLCLTCSETWLADAIANVALFVPLGVALCALGVRRAQSYAFGAACSFAIEALQYSGHPAGRTAAVADLVTNTAGTMLGVWIASHADLLLAPTRMQARRLVACWLVCAVTVWCVLDAALQPATPVQAGGAVRESALPFTPGYGWLQREVDGATVNGVFIPHRGSGSVRVAVARTASVSASVLMRGRDSRDGIVPIVFVHDPAMQDTMPRTTRAHLLLAQRGTGAWLASDLRAGRWGLAEPGLLVRGVFRDEAPDSVALWAVVTPRRWQLEAVGRDVVTERLTLSPLIGWSMVQTVVEVSSRYAPVMTALWVSGWLAPLAYWLARALRRD